MGKQGSVRTAFDDADDLHKHFADEAVGETRAQLTKWGVQNHPALHSENARRGFSLAAERYKALNDARVRDGSLSWDGILLEEVFEALECTDPFAMIDELVQVAAVAISFAASIERNNQGPDPVTVVSPETFEEIAGDEAA